MSDPFLTPGPVVDRLSGSRSNLFLICLCFVCSGIAALVYQTVWARKFALVFGTSELAIAAVLAAYMAGLALGAWFIEKRIRHVRRPLVWYANIEAGIAVVALLLVPVGLWLVEQLLVAGFGGQPAPPDAGFGATTLYFVLAAFVVLLLPTTLMGATLPLLVRHAVHSDQQIGGRIGLLYACNTAGAVGGALLGALVLLPEYGLTKTVWLAAAINFAVALLALALSRTSLNRALDSQVARQDAFARSPERMRAGTSAAWVLPLMLVSGAVSFLHEVLWTRMLGHVLGSSIQAFGVMLASFLAGIAIGGGAGALLARHREIAARWLAVSELAAAVAAVGAWYVLQKISPAMESQAERVVFGFGLLFALAFAIGLTYPLAVRILARDVNDAAAASARVYFWNTIGAIVGAIAGGFLVVPALRYEGAVQLAVIASCALSVVACFALYKPGRWFGAGITTAAVALAILFAPVHPDTLLRYSPLQESGEGELLYYDVGRSAAVVTMRLGDQLALRSNGLPEAAIDIRGTSPRLYPEAWMAPLAVLARPSLQDILVVGFGGGRVIEAVPPSVQHVDVIELEQKIMDANRDLTERGLREPAYDPLRDPRVNLIINDARGALALSTRNYDAIVSQPSHPWTAGASHLYTREFMQQASAHLNPDGIFVQWMNVRFLDETLLRSLLATLNYVYPHVRVYRPEPRTLLFMASHAPIEPERSIAATRAAFAAAPDHYGRLGLNVVEDLVVSLVLDDAGSREFAEGGVVISDDNNRFAVASVHDIGTNISAESLDSLLAPFDTLLDEGSFIYRELGEQLAFEYVARRVRAFAEAYDSGRGASQRLAKLRQYYAAAAQQPSGNSLLSDATQLTTIHDWRGVAELDSELARIPWTSPLNSRALRMRITWRANLQYAESSRRFDADNIAMIDRLDLVEPDPGLYLLRAISAGDEPHFLTESLFRYTLAILQGVVAPQDVPPAMFGEVQNRFAQLRDSDKIYPYHYLEVQSTVQAAAALLQ